jgi:hypothetical protein
MSYSDPPDDLRALWISYGRGFRRCLEMMLSVPSFRIRPTVANEIRANMRKYLTASTPDGAAEGFDSIDPDPPIGGKPQ